MDSRERALLELKRRAGLASQDEIRVLDSAWIRRGETGELVVPPPATSLEQWAANVEAAMYGPNEIPLAARGFVLATPTVSPEVLSTKDLE